MSPSRPQAPRDPAPTRPARPTVRPAPVSAPQPTVPKPSAKAPSTSTGQRPATPSTDRAAGASSPPSTGSSRPVPTPRAEPDLSGRSVTTYAAGRARALGGPLAPPVVSPSSSARFAERARARRSLARRQLIIAAAVAVAVVGLGWLLFVSPVLALDPAGVKVEGAGTVVAVDQVQAVVSAHARTPLPRLDTVALRDDLLDVPGVREARVTRAWPHGLTVTLVAREPVAAVPDDADTGVAAGFALLDQDGVQVGRVDAAPAGLPVVDVPVGDKRTLAAVLGVLEQLPPDLLAQVQGVSAHTQDTVTMQLRDGVRVDWGSAHETPLKVAVLGALRASPAAAGSTVIDVSAPRLPITK